MAAELGLSKISLREALARLEQEEIYAVRIKLEHEVAVRATEVDCNQAVWTRARVSEVEDHTDLASPKVKSQEMNSLSMFTLLVLG